MAEVRCPNCGKYNPADQDLCQFCYTKLKPSDELPLSSSDDLMSLLGSQDNEEDVPEWLRDLDPGEQVSPFTADSGESEEEATEELADSAFSLDFLQDAAEPTGEPDITETGESPFAENEAGADWLSELERSRSAFAPESADEGAPADQSFEETMDWLSSLDSQTAETGAQAEVPDLFESSAEETAIDWSKPMEEPDWLQPTSEAADSQPDEPAEEEDWLASLEAEFETKESSEPEVEPPSFDFQAASPDSEEEQPDWLSRLGPQEFAESESEASSLSPPQEGEEDLEFTLQEMESQAASEEWQNFQDASLEDQADWMASLEGQDQGQEEQPETDVSTPTEEETSVSAFTDGFAAIAGTEADQAGDWFSQLGAEAGEEGEAAVSPEEETISPFTEDVDEFLEGEAMPDWFSSTAEQPEQPVGQPTRDEEIPDWLRDAGEGESPFGAFQQKAAQTPEWTQESAEASPPEETVTPDWLSESYEEAPEIGEPAAEASFASFETEAEEVPDWLANLDRGITETPETGATPAFVLDEKLPPFAEEEPSGEPVPSGYAETPDWLEQITGSQELPPIEAVEPEAQAKESLAPAELPGWLEAMRPSEGAVPFRDASDDRVENQGVLAGLPGILAAEYDLAQVGKPPTYSIKLQVPQDQQERLDLLKSMLSEEEQPAPAPKSAVLPTTYILRLLILGAFILGAVFAFWAGERQTPIPEANSIPQTVTDLNAIVGSLPDGAPVLLAFDYQPSSIPELEAASTGLVNQLLEKGSLIRTVSTNNTGPALAKRMIDQSAGLSDQPGQAQPNIAHLGYIPGGPSGLQAFGRDPAGIMRYDLQSTESGQMNAWQPPAFNPEAGLANFALVMVIADNGESARSWIEQIGPILLENQVPLVMVVSAQIEPMVLPYYFTVPRQVAGIATGVMGGVYLENLHGRSGPATTLMDAYSLTLAVAVVLLLVGSLVYLITGQLKNIKNLKIEGQA